MQLWKKLLFIALSGGCSVHVSISSIAADQTTPSFKWRQVQEKAQNTVVQVIVSYTQFDWAQPYNTANQRQGCGSGFFINDEGYLITNFHVIDEATAIWIHIPALGKEKINVHIVGACPSRDIALLKIDEEDLFKVQEALGSIPYLKLGNSDHVYKERSQKVLVLGYPLGQESLKSTLGIISGFEDAGIQIDAAVNRGNSGGPLLNRNGEVIGINTSIRDDAQNVNYAIPINQLSSILADLFHNKLIYAPRLGGITISSNAPLAHYKGNPDGAGCYILKVLPGSLCEVAGIKEGDMLCSIDGYKVDKYGYMNVPWAEDTIFYGTYLRRLGIKDVLSIKYYRDGELKTTAVNFDQYTLPAIVRRYPVLENIDYEIIAGMVIMPLTLNHIDLLQEQYEYLKLYRLPHNQMEPVLVISHLFGNSSVARSEIPRAGLIIDKVNGISVKTLEDFREALEASWQSDYLVINVLEEECNIPVVIPFDQALLETIQLASLYNYPISSTVLALLKKNGIIAQ